MYDRYYLARVNAKNKKKVVKKTEDKPTDKSNPASKQVLAYVKGKLVGTYDSLTKCANTLGMSRPMVKNAIDNGVVLENGFILKLKK